MAACRFYDLWCRLKSQTLPSHALFQAEVAKPMTTSCLNRFFHRTAAYWTSILLCDEGNKCVIVSRHNAGLPTKIAEAWLPDYTTPSPLWIVSAVSDTSQEIWSLHRLHIRLIYSRLNSWTLLTYWVNKMKWYCQATWGTCHKCLEWMTLPAQTGARHKWNIRWLKRLSYQQKPEYRNQKWSKVVTSRW